MSSCATDTDASSLVQQLTSGFSCHNCNLKQKNVRCGDFSPKILPTWTAPPWNCFDIFVCCSFSGCSVSVTSASRLSSSITHNSAAPAAFHRTNAPHIAHVNIPIKLNHTILYCYESWLKAISIPSRSLRVPGAAMVRREEGSTTQKRENVSRTNSPREEEEIMMEPIPRVEEQVAEVVMG